MNSKIARLGLLVAVYAAVPVFMGGFAMCWLGFADSSSDGIGVGFFVFLVFACLVFTFLTFRLGFLPKSGWLRCVLACGNGVAFTAAWFGVVCRLYGGDPGVILQESLRG